MALHEVGLHVFLSACTGRLNIAYADWATIEAGLANKLGAFIQGSSRFIAALGVDHSLAAAFIAVVVVSFALTTLDSATRLLRFNVSEIGASFHFRLLENRFLATFIAVAAIAFFAFYEVGGKPAGLALWTLFGTTNQLLAGLTLLIASLYLYQRGRNPFFTAVPMLFMLVSTFIALIENLMGFYEHKQHLLLVVGMCLLLVAMAIVYEGLRAFLRRERRTDDAIA